MSMTQALNELKIGRVDAVIGHCRRRVFVANDIESFRLVATNFRMSLSYRFDKKPGSM